VDLSVKHRVLSPFTAMLVLETDFDYARFGLDRKALANILTVGPGGLEIAARSRSTQRGARDVLATRKPDLDVEQPLEPGEEREFDGPDAQPDGVPSGVAGGVPGGVEGGVVGGVVGGTPGGVVGGVASSSAEAMQPAEVPSDDAPLRVTNAAPSPPPPPPVPRIVPREGAPADRLTANARPADEGDEQKQQWAAPYTGRFAEVMKHLANGRVAQARTLAESWLSKEPGDVLALLALGEAWEAAGEKTAAARAYGSLIDLFPSRVDMRRLAGERLERLGAAGLDLAIDTYQKAVLDRPDHPTGHRLLAWALLRAGRYEEAFAALEKGIEQEYPQGRFAGLDRVLQGDLGLLGAAWLSHEPGKRGEVLDRLQAHSAHLDQEASLRFILTWETDANDVDLHVFDRKGAHAYYNQKTLPSGGELYEDVTTGYGPECFTIEDPGGRDAAPYRLKVHYYRRGPMGYGMGTVQVVQYDGDGKLTIEPRPFVVMADNAMVDLGTVKESRGGGKAGR
jgi:tetratricopeptide repeat protein